MLLQGCAEKKSHLELIQERGAIHVATRSSPTTYQRSDRGEERGLEYELVRLFAATLGIDVKFIPAGDREQITGLLGSGQADLAAAGLARTFRPDAPLVYGPGFQWVTRQVVYRYGYIRPSSLANIPPTSCMLPARA